jgi:hypothetical protein
MAVSPPWAIVAGRVRAVVGGERDARVVRAGDHDESLLPRPDVVQLPRGVDLYGRSHGP